MNDSTWQHRHIPLLPGFLSFLRGEWNPQTLPDCCCFQRVSCCSAEFNSDVLKLQRKSIIKSTWKGLLIPMCGYIFWKESVIKGLIFCVPAARFKPSLLVGFCCVPKFRLMFMTYSLALCRIIIALLGCAGGYIQEYEIFLSIFFIPTFSCSDSFPALLPTPFWFSGLYLVAKMGEQWVGACHTETERTRGRDRSLWSLKAVGLFPLAGCPWGLQHSSLQNPHPGSQMCGQDVCRGSSVPSSLSILCFMGIKCPGQTLQLMAKLGSEKPANTKTEMQENQWATGTNSGKLTTGK